MKGYVYLDPEGNLIYKDKDYIDNINPLFWTENEYFVLRVWTFDTEDDDSMWNAFLGFRNLQLKGHVVQNFCKSVGFDLEAFKQRMRQRGAIEGPV